MALSESPTPLPKEQWAQRKSKIVRFFVREKYLETVPGVIITQHAGGGKANQYFLRGFNLDHGTDFAVFLDGMPLNLPSHAHGEGYADMNIVIPELVQRVNYEKGPYYADVGNYGSAGSAHLEFFKTLPENFVQVEGGMYGYARAVFGVSQKVGSGTLLYGGEAYHDDGPWTHPDDYAKFNGLLTYSQGDARQWLQHHGPRLPRQMELERSDPRYSRASRRLLRHTEPDRRRQFTALQPAGRMASRTHQIPKTKIMALRILLRPRSIFRFHVLPDGPNQG